MFDLALYSMPFRINYQHERNVQRKETSPGSKQLMVDNSEETFRKCKNK